MINYARKIGVTTFAFGEKLFLGYRKLRVPLEKLTPTEKLVRAFEDLGIRTISSNGPMNSGMEIKGFPVQIPIPNGEVIWIDVPHPGPLAMIDPDQVGLALLDPLGHPSQIWGVAKRSPMLKSGISVFNTELRELALSAYEGNNGVMYFEGYRYFAGPFQFEPNSAAEVTSHVFLLVMNASEEKSARQQAQRSWRFAEGLKRLGKILTMNRTTDEVCVAAAHEIASISELAAALIWKAVPDSNQLELVISIGVNRNGANAIRTIDSVSGSACLAELVASTRQEIWQPHVMDNLMTGQIEGKFCYLPPGGIIAYPLVSGDRLLGVLELVGRDGDPLFLENRHLFETFAEHLSLALNAASMFELAQQQAAFDALTGVANHRTMQEFLHQRLQGNRLSPQRVGVIMIDVDHFRSFNEDEGHDVGDDVLRKVAATIRQVAGDKNLTARYGGEEFAVIAPDFGAEALEALAERIREQVEMLSFELPSIKHRSVTVSLGCAVSPEHASDSASLLKAADTALYQAKRGGRNRVEVCHTTVSERPDAGENPGLFSVEFEAPGFGEKARGPNWSKLDLEPWLLTEFKTQAAETLSELKGEIEALAGRIPLSHRQEEILAAVVQVETSYRHAVSQNQEEYLRLLESTLDGQALLGVFEFLDESFDGSGKKGLKGTAIPVLARVGRLLLALIEADGAEIMEFPERFDPQLIAWLGDLDAAA